MPRKLLVLSDVNPYHIVARSNNKDWFDIPMPVCMAIFLEVIEKTKKLYGFEFHTFILMANHFHMILSTPHANLDEGMRYFMTETSRRIARAAGRINKIYGQRYHWTEIKNAIQYAHAFRYNFQNSTRAKIVQFVEDYNWSSLRHKELFVPNAGFSEHIPDTPEEMLAWLNTIPDTTFDDQIKRALRRFVFKFPRDPRTKKYSDHLDKL